MRTLDRRIDIERFSHVQDGTGQEVEAWSKIATRRPAAIKPVRGDERYTAAQFVARQQVEFTIRWAAIVADLSPTDRIIYPSATSPADVDAPNVYDIIEVSELGRREGLRIIAARRAEE
jgi:SPP1 family predicted phage head-tail adaptor